MNVCIPIIRLEAQPAPGTVEVRPQRVNVAVTPAAPGTALR